MENQILEECQRLRSVSGNQNFPPPLDYATLFSSRPAHENPTPQGELNQIRPLTIEQLSRGYTVKIGCQTFAFSNKEELILKLISYLNNPKETEQKWFKNELF